MAGWPVTPVPADWNLSPRDGLTVQGDFLKTQESQTITTLFLTTLFRS